MSTPWAILTGEYPPQPGGVSDYTRQLAEALAEAGENAHVFAPALASPSAGASTPDSRPGPAPRPTVHRLPGGFAPGALAALGAELDRLPAPRRLLLQYTPHAFGLKAMNLPLCLWLASRARRADSARGTRRAGRRDEELWVMFHEVQYPFARRQPWRHSLLAAVNRVMAGLLARAASRLFVSIPAWRGLVRPLLRRPVPITWLPVPSNLPTAARPDRVRHVRGRWVSHERPWLVGHFGSFGPAIRPLLGPALRALLHAHNRCNVLLLGRGAADFAAQLGRDQVGTPPGTAGTAGRIFAAEDLAGPDAADHLAACNLLLQPYPDGASSRRSSLMAGLALGVPVVTTAGPLSEPLWQQSGAVALAPASAPGEWVARVVELLDDAPARAALGQRGRDLYARRFALALTVAALRDESGDEIPDPSPTPSGAGDGADWTFSAFPGGSGGGSTIGRRSC